MKLPNLHHTTLPGSMSATPVQRNKMVRDPWFITKTWLFASILTIAIPTAAADEQATEARRYYYDDITRFYAAYDRFMESGEPAAFADYLEQGTTGLKEFESQFALTPELLAQKVRKYPAFFSSIRDAEAVLKTREGELDAMFARLQTLFPGYTMPSVYFVIGGLRAGGQAGDGNYVMVAAELYMQSPGVDTSELSPNARLFSPDEVVHIVAHEAAHVIQEEIQGTEQYLSIYTEEGAGTLLAYSLREGAANLVAQLTSDGHINAEAEAYGIEHESELWPLFREQALGTELGDWFFYRPKSNPEWPVDLGYWMGYRMARKCYESADDKPAMLRQILDANDPAEFLQECGLDAS